MSIRSNGVEGSEFRINEANLGIGTLVFGRFLPLRRGGE